jgi:hypothetical protein
MSLICDTVSSGKSREDRLPGLMISKQERTRLNFCIRQGVADADHNNQRNTGSLIGNRKRNQMTKKELGNALPIKHLSLARIIEIAEHLEKDILEKKGKNNYEAAIYYLESTMSQNTIGMNLWDIPAKRINNEEEWNTIINEWDSAKSERIVEAAVSFVVVFLVPPPLYVLLMFF